MTYFLNLPEVLHLNKLIVGTPEALVRDYGMLESALGAPQVSVFGQDAYPDFHQKAAALLRSIARNHGFVDGNKRTAWGATFTMYRMNKVPLRLPDTETVGKFVLSVATGEMDIPEIAAVLESWSKAP